MNIYKVVLPPDDLNLDLFASGGDNRPVLLVVRFLFSVDVIHVGGICVREQTRQKPAVIIQVGDKNIDPMELG